MKKILMILTIVLMIFSITISSFAYEVNEDGNYVFTPEQIKLMLDTIDNQSEIIIEQNKLIIGYEKEIENNENVIRLLKDRLNSKENEILQLRDILVNREERIELLNEKLHQKDIIIENKSGLDIERELKLFLLLAGVSMFVN